MITVDLALALRRAGIAWHPQPGDRFALPDRGLDDREFVLSDMTIDVHELPTGPVIGFNGTVEWALDSVTFDEAVWLPLESQLRELLGATFRRMERVEDGYVVSCQVSGSAVEARDPDAACAYARALLSVLGAPDLDR